MNNINVLNVEILLGTGSNIVTVTANVTISADFEGYGKEIAIALRRAADGVEKMK